MTVQKSC